MISPERYNIIFLTLILVFTFSKSSFGVDRIENFDINRKKVSKVYLSLYKASVFRFPDSIEEIRIGNPSFFEAEVSKVYNRELTVFLKKGSSISSNLIVRTSAEEIYVFDLVPSSSSHQDVIFVDDSFYKERIKKRLIPNKPSLLGKKITLYEKQKIKIN